MASFSLASRPSPADMSPDRHSQWSSERTAWPGPSTPKHALPARRPFCLLPVSRGERAYSSFRLHPTASHSLVLVDTLLIPWRCLRKASFPGLCCGQAEREIIGRRGGPTEQLQRHPSLSPRDQDVNSSLQGLFLWTIVHQREAMAG